ncbi:LexA family protein [Spirosoma oryzicola]|uniref:LexA family protein n=1 Tax=Spirosoma oryzicola TaxID=2898794 RepID=UPI001E64D57C|nr:S24 family peptidase [Spirosoma oryzicola]UHG93251.1 DNA repair protein [Spirosoma oryzicola]
MRDTIDPIPDENIWQVDTNQRVPIPLFGSAVSAGFGNPAETHIEQRLNLQDLCVEHVDTTYFVFVEGDSMINDEIRPGTILVVDSSIPISTGDIVVGWVNGDCFVKRFVRSGKMITLFPSNPDYLPIYVHPEVDQFKVLGKVTHFVSKPKKWSQEELLAAKDHVRTR